LLGNSLTFFVPYTIILEDAETGSVSSEVMNAPQDTVAARRYATMESHKGKHVVAMVRGLHPVIIGLPGST